MFTEVPLKFLPKFEVYLDDDSPQTPHINYSDKLCILLDCNFLIASEIIRDHSVALHEQIKKWKKTTFMNSEGEDTNLLVFRICESHLSQLVLSCTRRTQIKESRMAFKTKGKGKLQNKQWRGRQKTQCLFKMHTVTLWMRHWTPSLPPWIYSYLFPETKEEFQYGIWVPINL
jgi:hypothetical protein